MPSKHLPGLLAIISVIATAFLGVTDSNAAPTGLIRATKTLYAFQQPPKWPSSLLPGSDGNFYGASAGGAFGLLFRVTPAGVFSILHDFKDDAAGNPISLTLGKDGNLYGILSSNGAIFKCSLSGSFTVLNNVGRAAYPSWLLQGSDGNLYGITRYGGTASQGSVFQLTPTGQLNTIYSFTGGSDGSNPYELIEGASGIFYGTSGGYVPSAIFKVTSSGVFNIVRDLTGTSDNDPRDLVYGNDGNIYGAYSHAYQAPARSLFRLTPNGDLTPLWSFGSATIDAVIKGSDGNLYCSIGTSETNHGTISRVTLNGQVTTLYSFAGKEDGSDPAAITFVPGQGIVGVTLYGSLANLGTVFQLDASGQFKTLLSWGTLGRGYSPNSALVQANDGSFYGGTRVGGSAGYGTLYHLNSSGELVTLHEFGGDTGAYPSLLVIAGDGRLYGASTGLDGKGSVYRLDTTGAFTVLHQFTDGDDGSHPTALVASHDGNIYGVATSSTNSGKNGSFFRITPAGSFDVVKTFDNSEGQLLPVGLVEAKDGKLYNLASMSDHGTLFQISPEGVRTAVHTFSGTGQVATTLDNLVAGVDGNLYGTTSGFFFEGHGGMVIAPGTVWQCTTAGAFKTLHSFDGSDELFTPTTLLPASDGNIYGLVRHRIGGPNSVIYRVGSDGAFAPIYKVNQTPLGALIEGVDGRFYGTSPGGFSPGHGGAVIQYVFGAPSAVNLATRMKVGTGDNVSIGGFIISGNAAKKVMLRGIGPSLAVNGQPLAGSLADPTLELRDAAGALIGKNDNWGTSQIGGVVTVDQSAQIKASGIAPTNESEAALIATLQPGSYTAVVAGAQNAAGLGLVEIYDLDVEADAQLANISTRGFTETGDNVLIGGFIIDGSSYSRSKLIVRALGPSLAPFGIPNLLKDPLLSVYDQNGNRQAFNGDWQNGNQSEIIAAGLAPKDARESAVYMELAAGSYTALVSGEDGGTGVALVETYNLP